METATIEQLALAFFLSSPCKGELKHFSP